MRLDLLAIVGVAACGASSSEPTPWRQQPAYHIDSADDVRWPAVRTMFVGTIHQENQGTWPVTLLELDDNPAGPFPDPPLIALHGISDELRARFAEGSRAAVSGIGRRLERDEAAVGAVIALDDVQHEPDITAPQVSGYALLRRDADLSMLLASTYVTAEGVVVERDGQFRLQLPSGESLRLWVVACDGETHARAQLHQRRRVYGRLVAERDPGAASDDIPTLGIGFPRFE